MTVWYHLTTIFRRSIFMYRHRTFLPFVGLLLLFVAIITTSLGAIPALAAPNVTKTIGFQGRLLNAAGVPVPDGYYNVQFKLYEGGTGTEAGNPGGTLKWTETHINDGQADGGVQVKNGFLAVDLGAVTPFGTSVNWDADTIWLSVNVAGNTVACSDFGGTGCVADGEMLPMKRITATPYAINSGAVNGKTADDLVQLGQGVQTDAGIDTTSIFINKTGSGDIIKLQDSTVDVFTIKKTGAIEFGSSTDQTISVREAADDTEGSSLSIAAGIGGGGTGADGGTLSLQGGNAGGVNGNGGDVIISGGSATGTGSDGLVIISTPAYKTAVEQSCNSNCTVNQDNIDNNGAVILNAETADLTFTLNDPTRTTAGRVIYATAAGTSEIFTLSMNGGTGTQNTVTMKPNMTATLFWNGSDWTTSSLSSGEEAPIQRGGSDNVQVGNGADDTQTTLMTLDKSSEAPEILDQSLVGSMYYDTTLGKVQCYEAEGWGDCGSSPDTFVSVSPEYANSVTQGSGIGQLTSGICSSDLGIYDGSNSQLEICSQDETYNFYHWTSDQATTQEKSIFITHELPANFKEFVSDSAQLLARTDSADATVDYQIYKKGASGLTACGTAVVASTGAQTGWQSGYATGTADPADCGFEAGESIVIKITMESKDDAHAYVSTLKFAYSNK